MTLNNQDAGAPSLADLPRLRVARVVRVADGGAASDRLRELGFTAGTRVEFVRAAPLGDPLCFRLRGTEICLRKAEARRIEVAPEGSAP